EYDTGGGGSHVGHAFEPDRVDPSDWRNWAPCSNSKKTRRPPEIGGHRVRAHHLTAGRARPDQCDVAGWNAAATFLAGGSRAGRGSTVLPSGPGGSVG